jgi:hypothetical protein
MLAGGASTDPVSCGTVFEWAAAALHVSHWQNDRAVSEERDKNKANERLQRKRWCAIFAPRVI